MKLSVGIRHISERGRAWLAPVQIGQILGQYFNRLLAESGVLAYIEQRIFGPVACND